MDAALQKLVRQRARFRCEYCLLPEALVSTPFQLAHIIAQFHDGPNVAGVDPATGEVVRLFHPRRDGHAEHYVWQEERMEGLTPVGRATVRTLRLNHPLRLVIRRSLLLEGVRFA